jgi:hypothetical protein
MIRTFGVLAHATRVLCLAGIALAVGPTLSVAAETPKPSLTAVLASEPPQIDGRLNEAVWQTAAVIDGLQQKIPVAYGGYLPFDTVNEHYARCNETGIEPDAR